MKLAPKTQQNQGDYSGLSTAELLAIIAEKEASLSDQDQQIQGHVKTIKSHAKTIGGQAKTIKSREAYISLLEEQLKWSKVQKFSASSEKLAHQIDLFDEVELEQAIADIDALLPDELLTEAAVAAKKTRKHDFSSSLTRVRVELTLTDAEKVGAVRTFFTKVKEELEYIPAQLNVLEYWQEKAVNKHPRRKRTGYSSVPTLKIKLTDGHCVTLYIPYLDFSRNFQSLFHHHVCPQC